MEFTFHVYIADTMRPSRLSLASLTKTYILEIPPLKQCSTDFSF